MTPRTVWVWKPRLIEGVEVPVVMVVEDRLPAILANGGVWRDVPEGADVMAPPADPADLPDPEFDDEEQAYLASLDPPPGGG